jgi:hypothetical protein
VQSARASCKNLSVLQFKNAFNDAAGISVRNNIALLGAIFKGLLYWKSEYKIVETVAVFLI